MVSGQKGLHFELVQRGGDGRGPRPGARCPAPSSLAVDLSQRDGTDVIGFLRGSSMNIYSGVERNPLRPDEGWWLVGIGLGKPLFEVGLASQFRVPSHDVRRLICVPAAIALISSACSSMRRGRVQCADR